MRKCVWTYFVLSVMALLFSGVLYSQTTTAQIS